MAITHQEKTSHQACISNQTPSRSPSNLEYYNNYILHPTNLLTMKQRLTLKSLEKASRAVLSNTSFASTPHHVSSIRLVKLQTPPIETQEEKLYRIEREDITKWHHDYWEANNKEFLEAKGHFIRSGMAIT